jgi:dihydroflavonol-4-reductase
MPDRVLLTGVSGFLGGHVASALLAAGYQVRGSVRNPAKADKARETLAKAGADVSRLEFVTLDLLNDEGWEKAAQGCRYLAHTASPFVLTMPADKMELIRPAIEGTERALKAGSEAGVERIVLTSSMAAIAYGHDRSRTAPFGAADWTDLAGRGCNAYIESKTRAERRAWEIMKAAGREADLAVINPSGIFGPLLDEDPGTSAQMVIRMLNGSTPAAPRFNFAVVGGRRFPMGERTLSLMEFVDILRRRFPAYASKTPRFELPDWAVRLYAVFDADLRGNLGELGVVRRMDSRDAVALLGRDLIKAEAAIVATGESVIAFKLV